MATLVFRLRHVPEDEADDIRSLLTGHDIKYYETNAGNWGISMPGIWLEDGEDVEYAKALIDDYQEERAKSARQSDEVTPTLTDSLKQHPGRAIGVIGFCIFVLYFLIKPFYSLA